MPNYPCAAAEVLNAERRYKAGVLLALKAFRRLKPWQGTVAERQEKFRTLHAALCSVYQRHPFLEFRVGERELPRGNGCFNPERNCIFLYGKLSVVTYLHEFAHAMFGRSERRACEWSLNLFRRVFPRSFASCRQVGHLLLRT